MNRLERERLSGGGYAVDVMEVLREALYGHRGTVPLGCLFGSLAEGCGGPLSDVDVAAFVAAEAQRTQSCFISGFLCDFCASAVKCS